jgi:hypothetical protein
MSRNFAASSRSFLAGVPDHGGAWLRLPEEAPIAAPTLAGDGVVAHDITSGCTGERRALANIEPGGDASRPGVRHFERIFWKRLLRARSAARPLSWLG